MRIYMIDEKKAEGIMNLREQYEKETGKKCCKGDCTDDTCWP